MENLLFVDAGSKRTHIEEKKKAAETPEGISALKLPFSFQQEPSSLSDLT